MAKDSDKPTCKYGAKCYRNNPEHLEEYYHPSDEDDGPPKKKTKIVDSDSETNSTGEPEGTGQTSGYRRNEGATAESDEGDDEGTSSGYVRPQEETKEEEESSEELPESPEDVKENIKKKFLVEMPDDFYDFWEFSKTINSKNTTDAFKSTLGLQLVGPYDILADKKPKDTKRKSCCFLRHWRYYYDPPEFQTVIRGDDKSQFHMGYFRDDPKENPVFMASNAAKDSATISPRGENIFAAVHWFLEEKMKKDKTTGGRCAKLKDQIAAAAKKGNYSLEQKTKNIKARDKKVVCKSFHGAGIVVPVDENEIGYRPVPETPATLKKMLSKVVQAKSDDEKNKAMDPIMEIVMLVQFANDECDYGEGLELGMDMFSFGGETLHKMVLNLLPLAYELLGRNEFAEIVQAHLKDRKHSADLSVLG